MLTHVRRQFGPVRIKERVVVEKSGLRSSMMSSAVVKQKIRTRHRLILGGCQGRPRGVHLDLDSPPRRLIIERRRKRKCV